SFGRRSVAWRSLMYISPAVSSSSPATIRRIVDLPHPEGPTSTLNWPSSIANETSSTATTSGPNSLVTPSSTILATSVHRRDGSAETGRCSGGRADLVQPDQGCPDHRRNGEPDHAGAGRHRMDAQAGSFEKRSIFGPEHAPSEHDVDIGSRDAEAADRRRRHEYHLVRHSVEEATGDRVALHGGPKDRGGQLDQPAVREAASAD